MKTIYFEHLTYLNLRQSLSRRVENFQFRACFLISLNLTVQVSSDGQFNFQKGEYRNEGKVQVWNMPEL